MAQPILVTLRLSQIATSPPPRKVRISGALKPNVILSIDPTKVVNLPYTFLRGKTNQFGLRVEAFQAGKPVENVELNVLGRTVRTDADGISSQAIVNYGAEVDASVKLPIQEIVSASLIKKEGIDLSIKKIITQPPTIKVRMKLYNTGSASFIVETGPWLSGWKYRRSHEIIGSSAGIQTDYQMRIIAHYKPFEVRGEGEPIVRNDIFTYDPTTGEITKKHDFLADTAHYREICPPPGEGTGYWAGAPSIWKDDDGTYYVVFRLRDPTNRGYRIELYSSKDLINWNLVWSIDKTEVSPFTPATFEKMSLRKYNGYYYLYFCTTDTTWEEGIIRVVKAATIEDLATQLKDSNNWIDVGIPTGHKDPSVMKIGEYYYMVVLNWVERFSFSLYRSSSPEGPFTLVVADVVRPYVLAFGEPDDCNTGIITYDESSGYFIYWGTARHGSTVYWFWTVSVDLKEWKLAEREVAIESWDTSYNTARYPEYFALDDQRVVMVMEYDHDGDYDNSLILWDYSDDAPGETDTRKQKQVKGNHVFLDGHSKMDFADVRFTADDGETLLDYWMEEKVDGDYAIFWVKVPSIPAHPNKTTIYVYYGNPDAIYVGDATKVFLEFEDFEQETTLTITDYEAGSHEYSSSWAKTGSYSIRVADTSTTLAGTVIGVKSIASGQYACEAWIKPSFDDAIKDQAIMLALTDDIFGGFRNEGAEDVPRLEIFRWSDETVLEYKSTTNWKQENIYRLVLKKLADGRIKIELYYEDGNLYDSFTTTNAYNWTHLGFRIGGGAGQTGDGFIDTLFLRKYADPEPTHGIWGNEEST